MITQKKLIDAVKKSCTGGKIELNKAFFKSLFYFLPPVKAIPLLESFHLPKDDYNAIYEVEIMKLTLDSAAMKLNMTIDTLKRRRERGYDTIIKSLQ